VRHGRAYVIGRTLDCIDMRGSSAIMTIRSRRIVRLAIYELYSLALCPNGMLPGLGVKIF
jgi:hypothetical protein